MRIVWGKVLLSEDEEMTYFEPNTNYFEMR